MKNNKLLLLAGAMVLLITNLAIAQKDMTRAPEKTAFSLNPDNLGALQNSINLVSGQVAFPMGLGTLSGRGGLNISANIQYNSAGTEQQVKMSNEFGPTGILGLGWSMDVPLIICDHKMTGTRQDDDFFLVEGGVSTGLICVDYNTNPRKYVTKTSTPWSIEFDSIQEKWLIVREDGFEYTYEPVQWLVKWGNWIGNSVQTYNQSRMAYTWGLTKVENLWGDLLQFSYTLDEEPVGSGGLAHTRAFYLNKVIDPIGQSAEFLYQDKDPVEYVDSYSNQSEPDAYQEKYQDKYLDQVVFKSERNSVLYSVKFQYQTFGIGNFLKRTLTSIQKQYPSGENQPAAQFSYFNEGQYLGYLKTVNNSLGANIEYFYDKQAVPGSDLRLDFAAPTGYGEPKYYVGGNYVVVFWRFISTNDGGPQPVKVQAFDWAGQWNKEDLWDIPSITLSDYDQMDVALTDRHFILRVYQSFSGSHQIYGARRNPLAASGISPAAWQKFSRSNNTRSGDAKADNKIFAGEDFVAYVPRWESNFYTWTWRSDNWEFEQTTVNDVEHEHFCTAGDNYVFIHNDARGDQDVLHLYYLDGNKEWKQNIVPQELAFRTDGGQAQDSYWHRSNTYVLGLPQFNPEFIYSWDENYQNFQKVDMIGEYPDATSVYINNSGLICVNPMDEKVFGAAVRYDGYGWRGINYQIFNNDWGVPSFGDDYIMVPFYLDITSPATTGLQYYNPNSNTWTNYLTQVGGSMSSSRLNDQKGHAIQAGINMLMVNDKLYGIKDRQLIDQLPLEVGDYLIGETAMVLAPSYVVYEYSTTISGNSAGIYMVYLENSKIKGYSRYPGLSIATLRTNVGFSVFASKMGSTVALLKIQDGKSTGLQSAITVSKIIWSDGVLSTRTSYSYSNGKISDAGVALFNVVKTASGEDGILESSTGYTEHYFYNGLQEAALAQSPPKANIGNELLLVGNLYRTVVKNANNLVVSTTNSYYQVFTRIVSIRSNGRNRDHVYMVRSTQEETIMDGITTSTANTYDSNTGLLTSSKRSNSQGSINTEESTIYYTYWWEKYDTDRSDNLISPIIQTRTVNNRSVNGVLQSTYATCNVVKWTYDNEAGRYYPMYTYTWDHTGDISFDAWQDNETPPTNWVMTFKINALDFADGTVLETQTTDGVKTSVIFDKTHTRSFAVANYAGFDQIAYTSFEDGSNGNWSFDNALVSSSDAFNGSNALHANSSIAEITKSLPQGRYEVAFWKKGAGATIQVDNGSVIEVFNEDVQNGWTLVRGVVELANGNGVVRVQVASNSSIDDVRVKPEGSEMNATVYNSDGNVAVRINNNLFQSRYEYDGQYRMTNLRNNRGEIVKQYNYHYKDQQQN